MRRATLLFLFTLPLACATHVPAASPAPAPRPQLRDAQGRAIIVHGINVSNASKSDPQRMPALTEADAAHLANDWGFDFVRFLVFWDAIAPSAGTIDTAYLDRVAQRVAWLGAHGISVLLDMHQDIYAQHFSGDGAPTWAIVDDGQPFQQQKLWSANYFQPAVTRAFDHFWDADKTHPELATAYVAAVQALARRFAADPNVIGYDLINEPFPGTAFDLAEALFRKTPDDGGTSKTFDETVLGPFYQRLIDAIREVDADHYVFFEPRYAAPANGSPSFLLPLHDPRNGEQHLVYAPHLYSTAVEANSDYAPGDQTLPSWQAARTSEIATLGTPLVLGEWGLAWSDANSAAYADQVVALADQMMAGWSYWSYDPGDATGWALADATGKENPIVSHVVVPYARRVAGDPLAYSFDPASTTFDLAYADRTGTTGPHEIFVPAARVYPHGWHVEVTPDAAASVSTSFNATTGVVSVVVPSNGGTHHVRVVPGP
jgi:endoglycosylceramidase